jgi:DNA-binding PucR family transcriptional regulator
MVHENTLRYRIRRLPDMFGLDLDDPETRLVTWLRLTIWKIQQD